MSIYDPETEAKVRIQLQHMADKGELVDWVMRYYPRELKQRKTAFGSALRDIQQQYLKKAGHTNCPMCGRQLDDGDKEAVVDSVNSDDECAPAASEPRFSQPDEEIAEWLKE